MATTEKQGVKASENAASCPWEENFEGLLGSWGVTEEVQAPCSEAEGRCHMAFPW